MKDAASRISIWFTQHDDGEFLRLPATHPYSVTVPSSGTRYILYTTKPTSVLGALEKGRGQRSMQVVGRAGLPNAEDVVWLRALMSDRPVAFLGDADPTDLLVFAWLRSQMPVSYIGVDDMLVQKLGVVVEDSLTIPLTNVEKAALALLADVFPDYKGAIGPQCAALLDRGRKIEIEAVISFAAGRVSLGDALAQ